MKEGYLITFEGMDGAGKTVLSEALVSRLWALGIEAILTREPGGTRVGQEIRVMLDSRSGHDLIAEAELLLFAASRSQLVESVIRPALGEGRVVVSDRFADSSVAYQGYGKGLSLSRVRQINEFATGGLVPDLTVLLDLPVEVGLARKKQAGGANRLDGFPPEFYDRVTAGFRQMATEEPGRWVIVDANRLFQEVLEEMLEKVIARLTVVGVLGLV